MKQAINLLSALQQNPMVLEALKIVSSERSGKFYIGAGAITQTVWNAIFGYDPIYGIEDLDIVYFDKTDLSEIAENAIIKSFTQKLKLIPLPPDIKNQARVHLWYKSKFGYEIPPLLSIEDAVGQWPTTANSIAIRLDEFNNPEIIAPFGLEDLFSGILRANVRLNNAEAFHAKAGKWIKKWPGLKIIPWKL